MGSHELRGPYGRALNDAGLRIRLGCQIWPTERQRGPQSISLIYEQGSASTSAHITLFIGFNFQSPSNMPSLNQFIQDTVTPGNRYFHHFLSEKQFAKEYAPSSSQVQALLNYLAQYNITPVTLNGQTVQYALGINVSGTVGNVEKAFGVSINNYLSKGRSFIANSNAPTLPTTYSYQGNSYNLAALVSGIAGMTTYNGLTDNAVQLQGVSGLADQNQAVGYSPQQISHAYGVNPLYNQHVTGSGETIAVATLAPFKPSDAKYFWSYYGIKRKGTLSEVGVDGQSTTASGYGIGGSETSLDVERSGAMAPGANIIVYEAPNTNPGFIDLYDAVATADQAQVMTTSWGEAEFFEPFSYAYLLNQAFMQGAAEGMTMIAASGDDGAYDGYPTDKNLAVDSPASSPDILAAGGTTLPLSSPTNPNAAPIQPGSNQTGYIPIPGTAITMTGEHGWGWDYLLPYYQNFGLTTETRWKKDIYPVGSTGGFSDLWTTTSPGTGSSLYSWWQSGTGNSSRGVPDLSLNADPFTGYAIYDTNSAYTTPTAGWTNGWGGTSFAAPQIAGMVALLDQDLGGPQGLLNKALYANEGSSAFNPVTQGDNWYYSAGAGWNAVTGLGTPNLAQMASVLDAWNHS
nr:S53 family peptidase [Sulfobacillus harzensis]